MQKQKKEQIRPEIIPAVKGYTKNQFGKDAMAGIIVAIIALPLSIAFALGCGVSAEKGVYSAIISSLIIALLGGSRVQITGPTGAFIIITQTILIKHGEEGLMLAMVMAGIMLVCLGAFRLGRLIKFVPAPITIGFTGGIAVTIFTLEVKDFLGLSIKSMPTNFFAKWETYFEHRNEISITSVLLGAACIAVLIIWPKFNKKIPNSFVALVFGTVAARVLKLDVALLGDIPRTLEMPPLAAMKIDDFFELVQPAFTIAVLVAMQALLSAVVTDSLIREKHKASMELIAEGIANMILGILGCIPATGGVARSIANVKNGGRTPVAAIFHAVTLLFFLVVCMPLLKLVPLSVLAAILIVVAFNMFNIRAFLAYRGAPKSDIIVLISSCVLTFAFDLVLAIEVGMVLSCTLFIKRMSEVTEIKCWKYIEDIETKDDPDIACLKDVSKNILVYEASGPLFFGAADKLFALKNQVGQGTDVVVLRMRSIPAIDKTALNTLSDIFLEFKQQGITMIFSHVLEQPYSVMEKSGFIKLAGKENFCINIDAALKRAEVLSNNTKDCKK